MTLSIVFQIITVLCFISIAKSIIGIRRSHREIKRIEAMLKERLK